MNKKAVIILSGGLDSATCMGIAHNEGYELYPITFNYGQRHYIEVKYSALIAKHYNSKVHKIVNMDFLNQIGGSALTDDNIQVPVGGLTEEIPVTYVPARNLIFLSLAVAYAEVIGAEVIYTGVNAMDYSGYPDCRPEFIDSMNTTANLATKLGMTDKKIQIKTPLINLTKGQIVEIGTNLEVPYEITTSCYLGEQYACGECDSCRLRLKGFSENNINDPLKYKEKTHS
ncbi:7-cyano-7-deazaguanine synthase QueC [Bacillus pumilus]|uniref:7-cyano-7-deazaguanine synthase QueC n=1 Tax=Bacillus pumilus TaxID=1408 RepID=UPI002FFE6BDD